MDDPIIQEVRSTREKLVAENGGLEGLLKYLRSREASHLERTSTPAQLNIERVQDLSSGAERQQ